MQLVLIRVQFDTGRTNRKQTLLGFAKIGDDLIDVIGAPLLVELEIPDVILALLLALLAPRLTHSSYSLNNQNLLSDVVFLHTSTNSSGLSRKNLIPFSTLSLSPPSSYLVHWVTYPIHENFGRAVVGGSARLVLVDTTIQS